LERTLLIIKPDAVDRKLVGHVIGRLEKAGFKILAMRMEKLTVPILLEKENAVTGLRELIGATDPAKAACGTLRQEIALDVQSNSVHASDAPETAAVETVFFFG